jgi:hypothetical protein
VRAITGQKGKANRNLALSPTATVANQNPPLTVWPTLAGPVNLNNIFTLSTTKPKEDQARRPPSEKRKGGTTPPEINPRINKKWKEQQSYRDQQGQNLRRLNNGTPSRSTDRVTLDTESTREFTFQLSQIG